MNEPLIPDTMLWELSRNNASKNKFNHCYWNKSSLDRQLNPRGSLALGIFCMFVFFQFSCGVKVIFFDTRVVVEVMAGGTQLAESNERRQLHRLTARQRQVRVKQRAQLVRIEARRRTLLLLPLYSLCVCCCDDSTTPDPRTHSPLISSQSFSPSRGRHFSAYMRASWFFAIPLWNVARKLWAFIQRLTETCVM